ncbi:hypothetical protein [Polaribacter sp.]|uniref:hypothetical protein n=1 Tax=Polaribacter sp. TaxID=1920175 RepID=UPI003F6A5B3C
MQKTNHTNLLLLFVFFLSHTFYAQEPLKISQEYLLFKDAKTKEPVIIVNDTTGYRGFNFETRFKTKFPKPLQRSLFNDYQYQIDDVTYLVENGCGITLTFKNNTFTRIDNSFSHKNQYFAIPFVYDNKPYLFSGYGLFTKKNIITYYDFVTNEWLLKKTNNIESISPRVSSFFLKKGTNLYVMDYLSKRDHVLDEYVRRLDLNTFTWHKEKRINKDLPLLNILSYFQIRLQIDDKAVSFHDNIVEVDFFNNTVQTFDYSIFKNIKALKYFQRPELITYVYESNQNYYVISEPYTSLKGKLISETPLYVSEQYSILLYGFLIVVFAFTFCYGCYKLYVSYVTKRHQLLYNVNKDQFFINRKIPLQLSPLNKAVLKVFLMKKDKFFELQLLNDALSKDLKEDNYITINKRRERVLKDLKFELSNALKMPKESVFSRQRSQLDKRMKEIKINITFKQV